MRAAVAVLAGLIAGCAGIDAPDRSEPIPYSLDANGVQLVASPLRIDFGRTDHSAISAMSKLVGSAPVDTGNCGAITEVRWSDGTALFMTGGDFRGWSRNGAAAGQVCR